MERRVSGCAFITSRFASRHATSSASDLAARGESPAAFGRRCIPAGCVAPPSNIPDILGRRALPSGRLAGLGATPGLSPRAARDHEDHEGFAKGTKKNILVFFVCFVDL